MAVYVELYTFVHLTKCGGVLIVLGIVGDTVQKLCNIAAEL